MIAFWPGRRVMVTGGGFLGSAAFRLTLAPLLAFSTALLLWNIVFSPFGNNARLLATYRIALSLLGLTQVRRETSPKSLSPTSDGSPLTALRSRGLAGGSTTTRNRRSAPSQAGNHA